MPSVSFIARVTIPGASTTTSETGIHLDNEHVKLQAVINGFAVPLKYSILDGDDDHDDHGDTFTPTSFAASNADNLTPNTNDNAGSLLTPAVELLFLPLQASVAELLKQQVEIREEIGLLWDEVNDHRRCTKPVTDAYQRQQHEQLMRRAEVSFDRYVASRHVDGPAAATASRRGCDFAGGVPSGSEKVKGAGSHCVAGAGAGASAGAAEQNHEGSGMQKGVKIEAQADEQQLHPSRKRPFPDL